MHVSEMGELVVIEPDEAGMPDWSTDRQTPNWEDN